jgi:hypothetical protein
LTCGGIERYTREAETVRRGLVPERTSDKGIEKMEMDYIPGPMERDVGGGAVLVELDIQRRSMAGEA